MGYNFQTLSYRFDFSNGLSATGIWFKENDAPNGQPVSIVLNDKGYKAAAEDVWERVVRGEQVLALDPLFIGSAAPASDASGWMVFVDSTGERSLGLEAAQLVAAANWLRSITGQTQVRLETNGIRSQMIALVAAAITPGTFSDVVARNAMQSLSYLIDKPVSFRSAPELFCLDLYKDFDIDSLKAIAVPVAVTQSDFTNR